MWVVVSAGNVVERRRDIGKRRATGAYGEEVIRRYRGVAGQAGGFEVRLTAERFGRSSTGGGSSRTRTDDWSWPEGDGPVSAIRPLERTFAPTRSLGTHGRGVRN